MREYANPRLRCRYCGDAHTQKCAKARLARVLLATPAATHVHGVVRLKETVAAAIASDLDAVVRRLVAAVEESERHK